MSVKSVTNERKTLAPAATLELPTNIKDGTYEIVLSDKPVDNPAIDLTHEPSTRRKTDDGENKDDKRGKVDKPDDKKNSADDASADAEDRDAKPRVPKGVQNRINRLTREKRELERLLEAERAAKPQISADDKGSNDESGPNSEDFDSWDEYTAARDEWLLSKQARQSSANEPAMALDERQAVTMPNEVKEAVASIKDTFDDSREKHDDFDKVLTAVAQNGSLVVSAEMTVAISESEDPGELIYLLAKNPEESQRIAGLPKTRQIKELVKLEASMQAPPRPEKKISGAPEPIKPLDGTSALPRRLSDAKTQGEYAEIRQEMDKGTKRGEGWL
ncbi:hypothetical protein OO006_04300 [Prosthecochloris sp. SCSIO W1101]|uniref:hypothetical protein n=1 Tax=Prosthecochloris sp. SCSIO W1101 TaxID=2992242 RepID=UPI00223D23FC|nr:hypothetical protein [Prosthecochloris sp. SCSIO W1101]UZJ42202.1 hypothetical protein OO006_04300 [Prosthecochloris sp. SCSIO W1101]